MISFIIHSMLGLHLDWSWIMLGNISMGGGSSSGRTRNFPEWAKGFLKEFVPAGESALSSFGAAGGSGGGALGTQASNVLSQELSGTVDPTLQATINAENANTQEQATRQFGLDTNSLLGNANKAGGLYSSGAASAVAEAAKNMGTQVAGVTDARQAAAQQQALQQQASAVGQAKQWTQQDLDQALRIASLLIGSAGGSSSNNFSVSGSL